MHPATRTLGLSLALVAMVVICGCGRARPVDILDASVEGDAETLDSASEDVPDVVVCVPTDETCDGVDNDCDAEIDEDFGLSNNPEHCGECNNECDESLTCGGGRCIEPIVELATGGAYTCARRADGRVLCWGINNYGQLGTGNVSTNVPTPTLVNNLTQVTQIVAGGQSTCALREDGTVRCWGHNELGQLADGTVTNRSAPVSAPGLTDVRALGPGPLHNCAILESGSVACWGWNTEGELGNGKPTSYSSTPLAVEDVTNAVQVQGGYQFTCALVDSGEMYCWGVNNRGQLGNGTTVASLVPQRVEDLDDVTQFAAGGGHVCAVREGGIVFCWGDNQYGQLARPIGSLGSSPIPLQTDITNAAVLSAKNAEGCALRTNGIISCWGELKYTTPGLTDAISISSAYADHHVCAIRANKQVVCWGKNESGQLGIGTIDDDDHDVSTRVLGI